MFTRLKNFWYVMGVMANLREVTKKYPSESFAYASWNKDKTVLYMLVDGEFYQKDASDVHPLETMPSFFQGRSPEIFLVRRSSISFK